jgi:hypothetical protein
MTDPYTPIFVDSPDPAGADPQNTEGWTND